MFIKGHLATKQGKIKQNALHFTDPQETLAVDNACGYLLRDHIKMMHGEECQ